MRASSSTLSGVDPMTLLMQALVRNTNGRATTLTPANENAKVSKQTYYCAKVTAWDWEHYGDEEMRIHFCWSDFIELR